MRKEPPSTVLRRILGFAAVPIALLACAPAVSAPPGPAREQAPLTPVQIEADRKLGSRLASAPKVEGQTDLCLDLVYGGREPDSDLRDAAMRRLRETEPRIVSARILERLEGTAPPQRVPLLELIAEVFPRLGGVDNYLNVALAEQIRSPDLRLASAAIAICARLRVPDSYIPMREILSRADSPLQKEAIDGIGQLADARAVGFFTRLLASPSAPRDEIFVALGRIGRPASLLLKSKLNDSDPADRRRALDALLGMATSEDLSSLYAYVSKYPPEGELRSRLFETIARIEAAQHERPLGD